MGHYLKQVRFVPDAKAKVPKGQVLTQSQVVLSAKSGAEHVYVHLNVELSLNWFLVQFLSHFNEKVSPHVKFFNGHWVTHDWVTLSEK